MGSRADKRAVRVGLDKLSSLVGNSGFESERERLIGFMRENGLSSDEKLREYNAIVARHNGFVARSNKVVLRTEGVQDRESSGISTSLGVQNKFYGFVRGMKVLVKQTSNMLWVEEEYDRKIWLSWGYKDNLACLVAKYPNRTETEVISVFSDGSELLSYSPLSDGNLEIISKNISLDIPCVQARKLINFGYGVCGRIAESVSNGEVRDLFEHPLSNLKDPLLSRIRNLGKLYVVVNELNVSGRKGFMFGLKTYENK